MKEQEFLGLLVKLLLRVGVYSHESKSKDETKSLRSSEFLRKQK